MAHLNSHCGNSLNLDEDLFKLLIDQSNDAIFMVDPETSRLLYVNQKACTNLGYARQELLTRRVVDFALNVPDLPAWKTYTKRIRREGALIFEAEQRRKDGTLLPVEVSARFLVAGGTEYLISVARDITERRQAAEALLQEKKKLEAVMIAIGDGITVQDTDFRITYQNQIHRERQGSHVGELCYEAYQGRDSICEGCLLIKSFADGKIHRRETTARTASGPLYMEVTACPLRDARGEIVAGVEVVRDITERRMAEKILHETRERLYSIISNAPVFLFALNREGTITLAEGKGLEKLGLSGGMVGQSIFELHRNKPSGVDSIRQALAGELSQFVVSGESFAFETWLTPIFDEEGIPRGVTGVGVDISERQQLEILREEMLSGISHEMRTPLTAMLGFTEFLLENEVPADHRREYLGIILKECERLKDLIDNLLSLQHMKFRRDEKRTLQPLDPLSLLREVGSLFERASAHHKIVLDCPSDLPPLKGDEEKLCQALKNLLSNAIKYSPEGGTVTCGARLDGGQLVLWVMDEGLGMPAEVQDQIFKRFYRYLPQGSPKISGTGLGLALVREVAEFHQGSVRVESVPGKGSTFYLTVPI